ncbi:MAG: hypothetical protein LBF04_02055 [Prevotellaceae bacterium]|jgi:hypothetical protein|nr:hypothetical protein [Prevotellaceae bacterium]
MKSFGIVEKKIKETDFFLEQLANSKNFLSDVQYYFSAFLSASRSITFALQSSISDIEEFKEWYEERQSELKNNDLARYFVEVRNLSQHVGYYPISSVLYTKGKVVYYFDHFLEDEIKNSIPKEDVFTACKKYFVLLLKMIQDCFRKFGHIIDPVQYFVYNITEAGKPLEDIEEELGFPRGWTKIKGIPEEERIRMLRREFEKDVTIDYVFEKYLGTDRFGKNTNATNF